MFQLQNCIPFVLNYSAISQLHDHHLAEVSTLMRIVHSNHDYVLEDWHLVLQTLDRLSYLPIRPNNLSEDGCRTALSMTEIYRRLSRFTTCLSHKSLKFFIDSVLELCKMSSFENTLDEQSPTLLNDNNNLINQKDHTEGMVNNVGGKNHIGLSPNRKDSFGGKFFNFARSFASGNSQLHDQDERVFISSKSRGTITGSSSKTYHQDFCDSTLDGLKPRLVSNNSEVVRGTEFIRSIPFPLILLAELSFENSFRFVLFGQSILDFLCDLAAGIGDSIKSDSPNVRLFAMNVLTNLVTSGLSGIADSNDMGCSKQRYKLVGGDVEVVDDCLRTTQESKDNIVDNEDEYLSLKKMSHVDLLSPLCRAISGTEEIDTANEALKSLHMIIEGVGHNLKTTDIWVQIIDSISTLAGSPPSSSNIITPALPPLLCKNRFSAEWSGCSALAFQLLKLIVDDFLDELPSSPQSSSRTMRTALLDCCAAFGCSMHDINTSLTATGMLWTIADQNSTLSSLDVSRFCISTLFDVLL